MRTVSWELVTGPVQEPVTLLEAKQHAHITHDRDDATLQRFIRTAREAAESYMNRGLFTQTWKLSLHTFADVIPLPRAAPLQSVAVQYTDVNGTLQTLATTVYSVNTASRPGSIALAANQAWPALSSSLFVPKVFITYVIGWTTLALIPERIKQGIRMYVTYLDADRPGMDVDGEKARYAAECCWDDVVYWLEPVAWCDMVNGHA